MIPFELHRKIPLKIRRPFYQRDVAIRERDEIAASLQQMLEKELFRTALERNYLQSQVTDVRANGPRVRFRTKNISALVLMYRWN